MRAKTNTITINGRTYDTNTGKPIDAVKKHTTKEVVTVITPTKTSAPKPAISNPVKAAPKKITVTDSKAPNTASHKVTVRVAGRHPQKSSTLMRHVVKKPAQAHKAHAVSGLTPQPKTVIIQGGVASSHQDRARQYTRSAQISRFGDSSSVTKRTAHIPVAQAPVKQSTHGKPSYDISDTPPVPHAPRQATLREQHKDLFETAIEQAIDELGIDATVDSKGNIKRRT